MTKKESRKDIEDKLIQIQKWLFENRGVFTEHKMSIVYAFSKDNTKDRVTVNAFTGGTVREIAATCVGIVGDLLDEAEEEKDIRKLFNLTAGAICEKFEKKMREEGYLDDDDDEEEEDE